MALSLWSWVAGFGGLSSFRKRELVTNVVLVVISVVVPSVYVNKQKRKVLVPENVRSSF